MGQYMICSFVQINIKIEIVTIELNTTIRSRDNMFRWNIFKLFQNDRFLSEMNLVSSIQFPVSIIKPHDSFSFPTFTTY
jgi:hypothetical protein